MDAQPPSWDAEKVSRALSWLKLMADQPDRGKNFLTNLAHDFHSGRISLMQIEQFLHDLLDALDKTSRIKGLCIFSIVDEILCHSGFLLTGPRSKPTDVSLVTVKQFDDVFCERVFDLRFIYDIPDEATPEDIFTYVAEEDWRSSVLDDAYVQGWKPLVWLTTENELNVHAGSADVASRVRDLLGLSHINETQYIIKLVFHPPHTNIPALYRPLAFDAGTALVFRTSASSAACGCTVDLVDGAPDGITEIVADRIPMKLVSSLRPVGYVRRGCSFKWSDVLRPGSDAACSRLLSEIEAHLSNKSSS